MAARWIVISNCQSFGLADCLQAILPDIECHGVDIWKAARDAEADPEAFLGYDLAIVLPEVRVWPQFSRVRWPERLVVPSFEFSGYMPDSVYVHADGEPLEGMVGHYHSLIALAGFKEGLSVRDTVAWFEAGTFAALGYLSRWAQERRTMVATFREHGFDIEPLFWTLGRGKPFMHTINHPTIDVMLYLARRIATRTGVAAFPLADGPVDRLADLRWPVYPAIADQLAVTGSYLFVPSGGRKPMGLEAFVESSFARFSGWDRALLRVAPTMQPILRLCRGLMAGDR